LLLDAAHIVEDQHELLGQPVVRARGRLAFVTWSGALPVPRITGKGVDIFGCWHWNHQEHGEETAQRIRLAAPLLEKLSTHRFTLNDVQQAFALQESGFCGKVLLLPAGDAL
jgi:L-iditol 2-dehydrogenase